MTEPNNLYAADHDYYLAGAVPSVALIVDPPDDPKGSYHQGNLCVTVKDTFFQASTPIRHATETTKILREKHSDDDVFFPSQYCSSTAMEGLTIIIPLCQLN